jgi:hypothetical protein
MDDKHIWEQIGNVDAYGDNMFYRCKLCGKERISMGTVISELCTTQGDVTVGRLAGYEKWIKR